MEPFLSKMLTPAHGLDEGPLPLAGFLVLGFFAAFLFVAI